MNMASYQLTDELCPKCNVHLHYHPAEKEGIWDFFPAYIQCPECDWQPGDEVLTCANCGEWSEERANVEGDLFCPNCAREAKQSESTATA